MQHHTEAAEAAGSALAAAAKSAPPVAVAGTGWFGLVPWPELAYAVTVVWLVFQMAGWLWDRFYLRRAEARDLWRSLTGGDDEQQRP